LAQAGEELLIVPDPAIELLTPFSGQGDRPLLQWNAVDGASSYAVTVYTPAKQPYWATQLFETQTHVGGVIPIDATAPGPRIIEGMYWSVTAFDQEMVPVAFSPVRSIAP